MPVPSRSTVATVERSLVSGKAGELDGRGEGVARLVRVDADAVRVQVEDVRRPRAVDVGEADAARVEATERVERHLPAHLHLGAEAAEAEVGPVADAAVGDADEVGEPVAAHVREEDRLRPVGEDERGPLLVVARLVERDGRAEAPLRERRVPRERVVDDQLRARGSDEPERSAERAGDGDEVVRRGGGAAIGGRRAVRRRVGMMALAISAGPAGRRRGEAPDDPLGARRAPPRSAGAEGRSGQVVDGMVGVSFVFRRAVARRCCRSCASRNR